MCCTRESCFPITVGLYSTFKYLGIQVTDSRRIKLKSERVEYNLLFLTCVTNSVQYWEPEKDSFAMIRQLDKSPIFLTTNANDHIAEYSKNSHKLSKDSGGALMLELIAMRHVRLVNGDPVTCCVYFNQLADDIMRLISSTFDYILRIEFEHRQPPYFALAWKRTQPNSRRKRAVDCKSVYWSFSVSADELPQSYGTSS